MGSIGILAIVFAVSVIIKITLLLVKPQLALRLANRIAQRKIVLKIIHVVLFVIAGFFIVINMSMSEVSAVMLLSFILVGLTLSSYYPALIGSLSKSIKTRRDVLKKFWLPGIIYLIIAIYTILIAIQPT